jgi:hypothetical protein
MGRLPAGERRYDREVCIRNGIPRDAASMEDMFSPLRAQKVTEIGGASSATPVFIVFMVLLTTGFLVLLVTVHNFTISHEYVACIGPGYLAILILLAWSLQRARRPPVQASQWS